jgi:hypothetical protein
MDYWSPKGVRFPLRHPPQSTPRTNPSAERRLPPPRTRRSGLSVTPRSPSRHCAVTSRSRLSRGCPDVHAACDCDKVHPVRVYDTVRLVPRCATLRDLDLSAHLLDARPLPKRAASLIELQSAVLAPPARIALLRDADPSADRADRLTVPQANRSPMICSVVYRFGAIPVSRVGNSLFRASRFTGSLVRAHPP